MTFYFFDSQTAFISIFTNYFTVKWTSIPSMVTLLTCELLNQLSSFSSRDRFSISYTHASFYSFNEKRQVLKNIASYDPSITFRATLLTTWRHVVQNHRIKPPFTSIFVTQSFPSKRNQDSGKKASSRVSLFYLSYCTCEKNEVILKSSLVVILKSWSQILVWKTEKNQQNFCQGAIRKLIGGLWIE